MRKFILTALLLAGCGTKAPMTLPEKYEAAVVIDNNFAETFWLEWKQTGAQLQGHLPLYPQQ
jgi:predicted small lipoprotein YifL